MPVCNKTSVQSKRVTCYLHLDANLTFKGISYFYVCEKLTVGEPKGYYSPCIYESSNGEYIIIAHALMRDFCQKEKKKNWPQNKPSRDEPCLPSPSSPTAYSEKNKTIISMRYKFFLFFPLTSCVDI